MEILFMLSIQAIILGSAALAFRKQNKTNRRTGSRLPEHFFEQFRNNRKKAELTGTPNPRKASRIEALKALNKRLDEKEGRK